MQLVRFWKSRWPAHTATVGGTSRQVLGFGTSMQMDAFLQQHGVYDYTVEDLDKDMATLDRVLTANGR